MTQPVIPHYRIPLFAALAVDPLLDLRVMASPTFPASPPSVYGLPGWADLAHPCLSIGAQLMWQRRMHLPAHCGPGDVLVVPGNPRILSNFPLIREAKRRQMGVVWWGHWWSPTSQSWRAQIRRGQMHRADVVLLYTEEEVQAMKSSRATPQLVMAARNALSTEAVDLAMRRWDKASLGAFRVEHALSAKLLLFCGRLRRHPPTGVDLALQALRALAATDPQYSLAVIGRGEDEGRLKRLAGELRLADRVHWLGDLYEEEQLAPWFMSACCLVYPGAIGLTLLHAFAYGLPVVTHAIRRLHNPEIEALVDGENGLMFEAGNWRDLCDKVRTLCDAPERRASVSARAYATVRESYSMQAMIRNVREAIICASQAALAAPRVSARR